MPGGGAVAQVRVAAVDAHAGQFLLLAVSGRGTTAGQDDAQGRCEGQRRETDSQSISQSASQSVREEKSDELMFGSARSRKCTSKQQILQVCN